MKKRIFAALVAMVVTFSFGTNLMAAFAPSQYYIGGTVGSPPSPPPSGGGGGGWVIINPPHTVRG